MHLNLIKSYLYSDHTQEPRREYTLSLLDSIMSARDGTNIPYKSLYLCREHFCNDYNYMVNFLRYLESEGKYDFSGFRAELLIEDTESNEEIKRNVVEYINTNFIKSGDYSGCVRFENDTLMIEKPLRASLISFIVLLYRDFGNLFLEEVPEVELVTEKILVTELLGLHEEDKLFTGFYSFMTKEIVVTPIIYEDRYESGPSTQFKNNITEYFIPFEEYLSIYSDKITPLLSSFSPNVRRLVQKGLV